MNYRTSMALLVALLASCSSNTPSGGTLDAGSGGGCATYCSTIMTNCRGEGDGGAGNAQYASMADCLAVCMAMPVGAAADTSGNTLGCRTYHARAAAMDPTTHCPHAGPGGAGLCGSNCEGYCQIAQRYCTGANQVYASLAQCMSTCAMFPDTVRYGAGVPDGNSTACLLWHVSEGSTNPPDHCVNDLRPADGGAAPSATCR